MYGHCMLCLNTVFMICSSYDENNDADRPKLRKEDNPRRKGKKLSRSTKHESLKKKRKHCHKRSDSRSDTSGDSNESAEEQWEEVTKESLIKSN